MTAALLWKAYREHRAVWVALACLAGLCLVGPARVFAPDGYAAHPGLRESLCFLTVTLAWTYGLVCGAMLLAGEREEGTLAFLDGLPASRLSVWLVKGAAGVLLLLAQLGVLAGLGLYLKLPENPGDTALGLLLLGTVGLIGLAWGLLCSAVGRSVLDVIGLAIVGQLVGGLFTLIAVWLAWGLLTIFLHVVQGPGAGPLPPSLLTPAALLLYILCPFAGSVLIWTRSDRQRWRVALRLGRRVEGRRRPPHEAGWREGWRELTWLSVRQVKGFAIGLALCGLVLGLVLPAAGLLLWPAATLLVGVLCGVTIFTDEQEHGTFRFLGEQRLPLGRVWLIKVGTRLALAVGVALLVLLPVVVIETVRSVDDPQRFQQHQPRFLARAFDSGLLNDLVPPGLFLTVWLAYGFGIGHLCGVLLRKTIVAAIVALGSSILLLALWIPSLLGGGLHPWQVAGVPLICLITGRLLMPAWTAGRLKSWDAAGWLLAGGLAAVQWLGIGLWYRVAEIPAVEDSLDMAGFVRSLPKPEDNEAGRLIRAARTRVEELQRSQPDAPNMGPIASELSAQMDAVLERGWGAGGPELSDCLDRMFAEDWPKLLREAADQPLGVVEDPRFLSPFSRMQSAFTGLHMGKLLALRGLQRQAQGDPAVFGGDLRGGLALSRNLRHHAVALSVEVGRGIERDLLRGLDRWLERLDGHPDLLKQVLAELMRHDAETPADPLDARRTGFLMAQNMLDHPHELVPAALTAFQTRSQIDLTDLIATVWQVPWERARQQRILRALAMGGQGQATAVAGKAPRFLLALGQLALNQPPNRARGAIALLPAGELKMALRLYQARTGRPAQRLEELVRRDYLPAVPLDPFDGQPFRYRLSRGERIIWRAEEPAEAGGAAMPGMPAGGVMGPPDGGAPPGGVPPAPPPMRWVPAGEGILWCVGEDGQDDGGQRQAFRGSTRLGAGEDLIFLVPPPAQPKGKRQR